LGDGTISTDPAPVHQYRTPGSYTISLTVRDSNGCINSIVYPDYVVVYEPLEIQMPSAFSPNGDGLNDEFFMVTKLIDQMEIGIFNRWGEEVYRSNNVNFRWDGRDKGNQPVPEGVYTYYMKGNYWNGKGFNRTGSVTVIR
jgi:gliding motility-associated-like protein